MTSLSTGSRPEPRGETPRQTALRLELNRLRLIAIVAPAAFVAGVIALTVVLADHVPLALLISLAVLAVTAAASLFSAFVFRVIETSETRLVERNDQLAAVQEAANSLSSELSLDAILQRFVDLSREITNARYGALAVLGPDGNIDDFITSGMAADEVGRMAHRPEGKGLLGVIIREGETLRMNDMSKDARSGGFPEHHPPMRSLLGVPVLSKGRIIGNLYLTDKEEGSFSEADEEMVRTFAANAAVAVENSRLQEKNRTLAVLQERERIGMDLHDGIIQSIYAIGLGLEAASEDVTEHPAEARGVIERSMEHLNGVIRDVRSYIFKLGPSAADGDIAVSLTDLATEFRVNSLIETSIDLARDLPPLDEDQQGAIYHVAQEALTNARKHAKATTVSVSLERQDGFVRLRVSDNGAGFDPESPVTQEHRGVRNMQSRARSVDGRLRVESVPGRERRTEGDEPGAAGDGVHGRGTTVELTIPVERER